MKKVLVGLLAGLSIAGVFAFTTLNNSIAWKYHDCELIGNGSVGDDGKSYYQANQSTGAIPTEGKASKCYSNGFNTSANVLTAPANLDTLMPRIASTLPEKQNINSRVTLNGDDQSNIYVAKGKQVDVWVTFLTEGADYRNSVGYFTWSGNSQNAVNAFKPLRGSNAIPVFADGTILDSERIIFPDASSIPVVIPNADKEGTTSYLGKFDGGSSGLGLGFFIASNGWSVSGRGVSPNRNGTNPNIDKDRIFYSVRKMNPECYISQCSGDAVFKDQHMVLLYDQEVIGSNGDKYRRLVVGMEDLLRTGGDHDFNDVLLAIHVKESEPGAFANIASIPGLITSSMSDKDGDRVPDALDEFPEDKSLAFSRYYPSKNTWGTLAFEDLWPARGDYDFNDVLIRYRSREILNSNRQVVKLEVDLRLDAVGAGYKNGFAINLPGIPNNAIASAVLTGARFTEKGKIDLSVDNTVNRITGSPHLGNSSIAVNARVIGGQNGSVFEIFRDATGLIISDNGSVGGTAFSSVTCETPGFRNTGKGCSIAPSAEFKLVVSFTSPRAISTFPTAPFDPFIFRAEGQQAYTVTGNTVEIHLPGRNPTSRANRNLFGKLNDLTPAAVTHLTTDAELLKSTYLSDSGLPWAINIPVEWNYPYEKLEFSKAYPGVIGWANSNGISNLTWFSTPATSLDGKELTFKAFAK
jgi:LruC domain-containing protein